MTAARLQRWAIRLSAYTYEIEFRRSQEHSNTDCLSRLPMNTISTKGHTPEPALFNMYQIESLPVTGVQLAQATRTDKVLSTVYRPITKGWPSKVDESVRAYYAKKDELTVESGCILWGSRVVIPEKYRDKLLEELHHEHPGICKMKGIARSYFWWPGLDCSIESLAKSCLECQGVKKAPVTAPLHPWAWPTRELQRIHIDFAGPFQGVTFLVAIDAYSKWPEVFVMQNTTVNKTVDCLCSMFCRYGYPEQVVSDNEPQFTAEEFAIFMRSCGVKHARSAPYHPSTNGLAERFVQSMKSLNTRARMFSVGDPVMVNNFRSGADWLPATVVSRLGPLSYLVETSENQLLRRHVDHVKTRAVKPQVTHIPAPDSVEEEPHDTEEGIDLYQPTTTTSNTLPLPEMSQEDTTEVPRWDTTRYFCLKYT